jgi:uncharacterized protein involved in outer membrane biogenesis
MVHNAPDQPRPAPPAQAAGSASAALSRPAAAANDPPDAAADTADPSGWPVSPRFILLWASALILIGVLAVGESLGWPFLIRPVEGLLSDALHLAVHIDSGAADDPLGAGTTPSDYVRLAAARPTQFGLRFFGALRFEAPLVHVAAPPWSRSKQLLLAHDVALELHYGDLWHAWRGQPLRIERLHVDTFEVHLQRLSDGRASWQASSPTPVSPQRSVDLPYFGHLHVAAGTFELNDALLDVELHGRLSLVDGASPFGSPWDATRVRARSEVLHARPASAVESSARAGSSALGQGGPAAGTALRDSESVKPESIFQLSANGWYRHLPLRAQLLFGGRLPGSYQAGAPQPVMVSLEGSVGAASLAFDGQVGNVQTLRQLSGNFRLEGPSLASVGDPLGVTLPTTGAFSTDGTLSRQGQLWKVSVAKARIGASQLDGEFAFEPGAVVPMLRGRLGGSRLLLADLGPALGTTALSSYGSVQNQVANAPARSVLAPGRVLPGRDFDLPALRVMDADVAVSVAEVDLGAGLLEPMRPLQVKVVLKGGVLRLNDIDARLGEGRLRGTVMLDGRAKNALMDSKLRWDGVSLDHWIHQHRAAGAPPYVSGRLSGSASLTGQGGSTAAILASLNGKAHTELRGGSVSHLAVEVAGLDLAASLGLLIRGDDRLAVQCAVADLVAQDGVFRPRKMVFDTSSSAIWVGGSLSLAAETLDLRAVVRPKEFSPLALRTPLLVHGSFAHPQVTLDRGSIGRKLGTSALLALVNPLAALIPLVELGDAASDKSDKSGSDGCAGLVVPAALNEAPPGQVAAKRPTPG